MRWMGTVYSIVFLACSTSAFAVGSTGDMLWLNQLQAALPDFQVRAKELKPDAEALYGSPSPNGRWLVNAVAYPANLNAGGTEPWGLRLYDQDGKFVRDLTYPQFYLVQGCMWSQTSDALYFSPSIFENGQEGLWKLDLKTNSIFRPRLAVRSLYGLNGSNLAPIWSPIGDSYLLVYTSPTIMEEKNSYTEQTIFRVQPKSKNLVSQLVKGSGPEWSPDGSMIAFLKYSRGASDVWLMDSRGTHKRPLMSRNALRYEAKKRGYAQVSVTRPVWVSGGSRLFVKAVFSNKAHNTSSRILLVNLRGKVLQSMSDLVLLSSSRDGRHFYFNTCNNGSHSRYFRIDLAGRYKSLRY